MKARHPIYRLNTRGRLSRRRLLQGALAAATLAACRPQQLTPTSAPEATAAPAGPANPAPKPTPETAPSVTASPSPASAPSATAGATPAAAPEPVATAALPAKPVVSLQRLATYDRDALGRTMGDMLATLGGIGGVVRPGSRVAIKVNLTGGSYFSPPAGVSAVESYLTHPEVVRALGEKLRDAGAAELAIVEALFDADSFRRYGYEEVAQHLGADLVDLSRPEPYASFAYVLVGEGWQVYEQFAFHPLLQVVDVFVSVAKMKCHCLCGVTLAMKNLVGLVPASFYSLAADHWWRSALHGTGVETRTRLPRAVVDLNCARPIHLAVIDGIMAAQGGEVPRGRFSPLQPGVLLAGKDPVATDAVATAVMGFDPTAEYPAAPFLNADNHLNLARERGLGTNRLEEIEVRGETIADVRTPFAPCWSESELLYLERRFG